MENSIWNVGTNLFEGGLLSFCIRGALILVIASIVAKAFKKMFSKIVSADDTKEMTVRFTGRIVRAAIYIIAMFTILGGIKPLSGMGSALLGATSVISVIIGLAAQESFGNFIAGFFLAMYQPFNVGDVIYIKDKDISGKVIGITFRHTEILTIENAKIIVPNSVMNTAIIENRVYGQENYVRYISFDIGYDSDIKVAEKLIFKAVLSTTNVVDIRTKEEIQRGKDPFAVRCDEFEASGIKLTFPLYTTDFTTSFKAASDVRKKLLAAFKENNIEIPYTKIQILK